MRATLFGALLVPRFCGPKETVVGDRAAWATPMPVSATVCGLLLASSVMVSVPLRAPVELGMKLTAMVQLTGPSVLPQVVPFWTKSPVMAILPMFKVWNRLFTRVAGLDMLVVPITCVPKPRTDEALASGRRGVG